MNTNNWNGFFNPNLTTGTTYYQTIQNFITKTVPDINVLIGGNRQSKKDGKIYLKDGQSFEIEFINRNQHQIAFSISFNGINEEKILVLNPGQRVVLDRFLSSDKKLQFNTYQAVDSNAINLNGQIQINVFYQKINNNYTLPNWTYIPNDIIYYNNITYCNNVVTNTNTNTNIETGRITEGTKSEQNFEYINSSFEDVSFHTESLQILPISAKPINAKDLVKKCKCGYKLKHKFNFCPSCGIKISN